MKCKPMFQIAHILCPCIFFLFPFSNELPCSLKDLECNGESLIFYAFDKVRIHFESAPNFKVVLKRCNPPKNLDDTLPRPTLLFNLGSSWEVSFFSCLIYLWNLFLCNRKLFLVITSDHFRCAVLCVKTPDCCSYEYSPDRQMCNLNKECEPQEGKHADFLFCKKLTPEKPKTREKVKQ